MVDKREHSLNLIVLQDLVREQKAEIEKLQTALTDFVDVMDILFYRVGLTVKDVADLLNPVGDAARAALKGKSNGR